MDVGNDPFPRDEVTGLAAFEDLEPVSALNVMPEPPSEPPPAEQASPRTFARPIGVAPVPAAEGGDRQADRPDKTEILDLTKVETVQDEPGWDDEDEQTSILTPAAFRMPAAAASPPAARLDMEWDEEEPPTRMRDEVPFLPPIGGAARTSPGVGSHEYRPGEPLEAIHRPAYDPQQGYEGHAYEQQGYDAQAYEQQGQDPQPYDDLASAGYTPPEVPVPAPPVGRPSPFPAQANLSDRYLPPIVEPAVDRGGAPSPFSATTAPAGGLTMAGRPAWMLVAGGAGVAVVLLLLGRALFASGDSASITVATTPADARVYIDGRPVSGTSSPYTASELREGPHELVVQKDGFVEHRSTFNLEDGETRELPAVELAATKLETGFAVNSMPSGATILVDGAVIGQTTPAKVTGIAPGVHKLQLQLTGHEPFELQVLVPETGVLQLPTAELAETEAAVAATSGRREARDAREAREPRERRERDSEPSASKRRSRSSDDAPVASRAEASSSRSAAGGGMLRLNSRPWSQVYVDGKLVGNTPQMGLPLSAGSHSVRLVNAQMGLTKTFTVSIKPGQMVTKVVNLVE